MKTLLLHPTDFNRLKPLSADFESEGIKLAEDRFGVCKHGFGYTIATPKLRYPMPTQYRYLPLAWPKPPKHYFSLST